MRFLVYDFDYVPGTEFTVWFFGDQHRINLNADKARMNRVVRSIKGDKNALWIEMGDHHDCIVPQDTRRFNPATIDYTIVSPDKTGEMADEVVRDGCEFFSDIMAQNLVFHRGNHEEYIAKYCGTDVSRRICEELGATSRYSLGMCTTTLRFHHAKHVAEFVINSAHGGHVPQSDGAGVTAMTKKLQHFTDADCVVRGHSHRCFLQPVATLLRRKGSEDVIDRDRWVCHSSSYLRTYAKDKQCYGEDRDYSPTVLRTPRLVLTPVRNKVYVEGRL